MEVADSLPAIKGAYSGKVTKMGQEIRVRIVRADQVKRQIEMDWIRGGKIKAVAAGNNAKRCASERAGAKILIRSVRLHLFLTERF